VALARPREVYSILFAFDNGGHVSAPQVIYMFSVICSSCVPIF
jgi:hypothetical protein